MRTFLLALLAVLWALGAVAQEATLIADRLRIEADSRLIAEGNVEVLYEGRRLTASRVIYDQTTGELRIEGPISLSEGDDLIIVASQAELDQDLQNGLLTSARVVLDQQLQLAANEVSRVDGRFTQMYKVAVTSCQVCENGRPPLWQIRARQVIHDQEERQLYFDGAQLRILDVPVLYIPRLRLPDPTLDRSPGFLFPRGRSTTQLGTGLKVPYFIPIGDHRDITLTPYISPNTRTLELRYRQAFVSGDFSFEGALTSDDLVSETRGYLFAEGEFDLPRGFELTFDIETTSDDAYLLEYGYSSKDRLDSELALTRTRADDSFTGALTYFDSLREDEDVGSLPPIIADIGYDRRMRPAVIGGTLDLNASFSALQRPEDEAGDVRRDVTSLRAAAHWQRSWTFGPGVVGRLDGALIADQYDINDDAENFPDSSVTRMTPYAAAELRWPLAQTGARGVRHVVEPIAQVVWSDDIGDRVPNEDSTLVEWDEGNLTALSRFPGTDAYEAGSRATLGATYTRYDPDGWIFGVTLARSFRDENLGQFSRSSGLDGASSDWLSALRLSWANRLSLSARAIFDDELSFSKTETRLDYRSERWMVGSTYVWLVEDVEEERDDAISEWTVDTSYQINPYWSGDADWRYDFVAENTARAGFGLTYRNECIEVGLSLSRRFTSSDTVEPSTDFDLTVALAGFSTGHSGPRPAGRCR